MIRIAFFLLLAFLASPALAGDSVPVPEGSALTLLALGLIGVIVGRRGAMRPKDPVKDIEPKDS
jgi:hypothetical protein